MLQLPAAASEGIVFAGGCGARCQCGHAMLKGRPGVGSVRISISASIQSSVCCWRFFQRTQKISYACSGRESSEEIISEVFAPKPSLVFRMTSFYFSAPIFLRRDVHATRCVAKLVDVHATRCCHLLTSPFNADLSDL